MNWRNLSIDFLKPQSVASVHVCDWEVQEGEIVIVAGRSGVGKSTFLRTLCGLVRPMGSGMSVLPFPYSASLRFRGQIIAQDGLRTDNHASYMPQEPAYLDGLSIFDNVRLLFPYDFDPTLLTRLKEFLEDLELTQSLNTPVELLSGGERQRVAFARCMLDEKATMFCLDEPFSQMDHCNRRRAIDLIYRRSVDYGRSFIIVSHEIDDLLPFATSMIVFADDGCGNTRATGHRLSQTSQRADIPAALLEALPVSECITLLAPGGNGTSVSRRVPRKELIIVDSASGMGIEAWALGPRLDDDDSVTLFVPAQSVTVGVMAFSVRPGSVAMPKPADMQRGGRVRLRHTEGHF